MAPAVAQHSEAPAFLQVVRGVLVAIEQTHWMEDLAPLHVTLLTLTRILQYKYIIDKC